MGIFDFVSHNNKLIEINKRYAQRDGWSPNDFSAKDFDEFLIQNIKSFQKQYGLQDDGIVGPSTYRRLRTEQEASQIASSKSIICNGKKIPIDWNKIVLWTDSNGLSIPASSYKKSLIRQPTMFVVHFDVCLSAKSCFQVLKDRNLSVQFLLDNDGTIYQLMDTIHIAQHAKGVNDVSIGVEISNAFYEKFNKSYIQMGLPPREVLKNSVVHGKKIESHLGFYDVQVQALQALCKAISVGHPTIKLQTPNAIEVIPEVVSKKYSGIIGHYHVTKEKIDPVGLDLVQVVENIK
jgi:hypothetical protein